MGTRTLAVKIIIRNDTSTNWNSKNPVLAKGEMGIEINTNKFKFGDGVTAWNTLPYASATNTVVNIQAPSSTDVNYDIGTTWIDSTNNNVYILTKILDGTATWKRLVTPDELSDLGAGDMLKAEFANNPKASQGYVNAAIIADKLTNKVKLTVDGDVEGSVEFDGSKNFTLNLTQPEQTDTEGTWTKVTVNSKGIVTAGQQATADDISGLGTAAKKDAGNNAGNVPVLDANGKLSTAVIPALALTDINVVETIDNMLALEGVEPGDITVVTNDSETYILKDADPSQIDSWVKLLTPTDAVSSVNGKTGAVVLTTTDVLEGENLYFTEERATANFDANIAKTKIENLADGADVLMATDTYVLDGGNA